LNFSTSKWAAGGRTGQRQDILCLVQRRRGGTARFSRLVFEFRCAVGTVGDEIFVPAVGNKLPQDVGWGPGTRHHANGDGSQAETFSRITLIEADPELPHREVEELARQLIADSARDRILVVVDYLQIWAAGSREISEIRHEFAKLMTAMRRLALSLDSPVLTISS
jgi:hypothetical protein